MSLTLQVLPDNVNELQKIVLKKKAVIEKFICKIYESERNAQEDMNGQFSG